VVESSGFKHCGSTPNPAVHQKSSCMMFSRGQLSFMQLFLDCSSISNKQGKAPEEVKPYSGKVEEGGMIPKQSARVQAGRNKV